MDAETGKAILVLAKEGGFLDEELPEKDSELIEGGQWWYEQAILARDGSMAGDKTVLGIIELAEGEAGAESPADPLPDDQLAAAEEEPNDQPEEAVAEQIDRQEDSNDREEHSEPEEPAQESTRESPAAAPDRNHGESRAPSQLVQNERFPVPPSVEGDVPDMPRDLTSLDDRALRKLAGEYNALLARARWLAAVEGSDQANAAHMAEHSFRAARRAVPRLGLDGKRRNADDINDEAYDDPDYRAWKERDLLHDGRFRELRALVAIYEGHIDRLSREASIRDQEYQRTRG